jgi:hypothetical protein
MRCIIGAHYGVQLLVSLDGNHRGVLPAMCTGAYSQAQVVEVTLAAAAAVLLSSAALRSALRRLR